MEAKRPRLASDTPFSHLPISDDDTGNPSDFPEFRRRVVPGKAAFSRPCLREPVLMGKVTDSREWGAAEAASFRAVHAEQASPANEQLLRTHHPALKAHETVWVCESQVGPPVWLVRGQITMVEAGGREIHLYPRDHDELRPGGHIITPRSPWKEDFLFRHGINPRKILSHEQLDNLRELFPKAVGARVLIGGFIVMLFEKLSHIQEVYERDWIREIGGLHVVYDTLRVNVTADTLESGMQVADTPGKLFEQGCLGLKLRLADGTETTTTVTHGFVKNPNPPRIIQAFADLVVRAKHAISTFRRPPPPREVPAVGTSRGGQSNSSVGKEVFLAGEARRIGTIFHSYDDPSSWLPYPHGYSHDLSLIGGKDMRSTALASPPGYPVISDWASYSEALSGADTYAVKLNALVGKWRALEGNISSSAIRQAAVLGSQYLWERQAFAQTASLVWQTAEPSSPEAGWSGSVLCLGKPTDASARAIVFQNFEFEWDIHASRDGPKMYVKAGFLLPEEIRNSAILAGDGNADAGRQQYDTLPRRSTESGASDRRSRPFWDT